MDIITVGAIVRSFASLLMNDNMSTGRKQGAVILMAIILFLGFQLTHSAITLASVFDAFLSGLTAGLTALGIYHATDTSVQTEG